ncbi:MAG: tetratricopeptide repeat protein [Gemmatimonadetes bacterium]|nr:tetratricopeptide repeat protein [Gemmatimonadota bacterium]
MSRLRALAALPLAAGAAGCVYLNGLYNAERAFDQAEQAQLLGRDSAAVAGWAEAEQKAERSWLMEPEGRWADRSRYVLGRARLRRGDFAGARAALEPVRAGTADPALRARATLYLGAVAVATGDQEQAILLLTEALASDPYVSVALGGVASQPAYEELERELREQLGGLLADVTAEVRLRDVVVRGPADSVAAIAR